MRIWRVWLHQLYGLVKCKSRWALREHSQARTILNFQDLGCFLSILPATIQVQVLLLLLLRIEWCLLLNGNSYKSSVKELIQTESSLDYHIQHTWNWTYSYLLCDQTLCNQDRPMFYSKHFVVNFSVKPMKLLNSLVSIALPTILYELHQIRILPLISYSSVLYWLF